MRFPVVRATALAVCVSLVASSLPLEAWAQMGKLGPSAEPLPLPEGPLVVENGVSAPPSQSLAPSVAPLAELSTLAPLDAGREPPALVRDARKVAASASKALQAGSLELAVGRLGGFDRAKASLHSAPEAGGPALERPAAAGGLSDWIGTALGVEADPSKAADWPAAAARLLRSDPSMPLEKAVASAAGRAFGLTEQDTQFLELSLRGGGRVSYRGPENLPAINKLSVVSGRLQAHTDEGVFEEHGTGWRKVSKERGGWPDQRWGRLFVVPRDSPGEYAVADGDLYARAGTGWAPAVQGGKTASSYIGSPVLVTLPAGVDSLAAVDRTRQLLIRSASSGSELNKEAHRPDLILPEGIWSWSPAPRGWREAVLESLKRTPTAKPASVGVHADSGRIVDGRRRTIFGGLATGLGHAFRDDGRGGVPWVLVFLTAFTTVLGAKALAAVSAAYLAASLARVVLGPVKGRGASFVAALLAGLSLATLAGLVTQDRDLYTALSVVPSIFSAILFAAPFARWREYRAKLLSLRPTTSSLPEASRTKLEAWARDLAATPLRRVSALSRMVEDADAAPLVPMIAAVAERDPDALSRFHAVQALAPHVRMSRLAKRAVKRAIEDRAPPPSRTAWTVRIAGVPVAGTTVFNVGVSALASSIWSRTLGEARRERDARREVRRLMGSAPPAAGRTPPAGVTGEAGEILDGRSRAIFGGLASSLGAAFSGPARVHPPLSGVLWLAALAAVPWLAALHGTPALASMTIAYGVVSIVMATWWAIIPERSPSLLRLMGAAAATGLAAVGWVGGPIFGAGIPGALTLAGLLLGAGLLWPRLHLPYALRDARPELESVPQPDRGIATKLADALADPRRRGEGIAAAGKSAAGAHVVPMLLRLAKDDPDPSRRKAALEALASLAPTSPSALEAVEELSRRRWDPPFKVAEKLLRKAKRAQERLASERVVAEAMGPAPEDRGAAPSAPIASEDGLLSGRDGRALFGGLARRLGFGPPDDASAFPLAPGPIRR